jgi:hypothetical protein
VPVRVSPTDRIRDHIDELFADGRSLPEILEEVTRLGAQLLMQAALEAEVTEVLGRDRYQRAAACEGAQIAEVNEAICETRPVLPSAGEPPAGPAGERGGSARRVSVRMRVAVRVGDR